MNENNKTFNLKRYFLLPYGLFISWGLSVTICYWIINILDINIKYKILTYIIGLLISTIVTLYVNYGYPRCKNNVLNIYILIVPSPDEDDSLDLDKYIINDLQDGLNNRLIQEGLNVKVVTPTYYQRLNYLKYFKWCKKNGKSHIKGRFIKYFYKWARANLYIIGTVKIRKDHKEYLVFEFSAIAAHGIVSKEASDFLANKMDQTIAVNVLVDKSTEYSGIIDLSEKLFSVSEYILGFAAFISSDINLAYGIFIKLAIRNKKGLKNEPLFNECEKICSEIATLNYQLSLKVMDLKKAQILIDDFLEKYPFDINNLFSKIQLTILKCNSEEDYKINIPYVELLLDKLPVNNFTKLTHSLNRGYISLLKLQYSDAIKHYSISFKNIRDEETKIYESVLLYCEMVNEKSFERFPSLYVKALILLRVKKDIPAAMQIFSYFIAEINDSNNFYYSESKKYRIRYKGKFNQIK